MSQEYFHDKVHEEYCFRDCLEICECKQQV